MSYSEYGPPERLSLVEIPVPEPGPGQVRVEVRACGLNASDWEFLTGRPAYARIMGPFRPRKHILGSDVAGTVTALGAGVEGLEIGQAVFADAFEYWGGLAEAMVLPADRCLALPEGLSFEEAASLPQSLVIAEQGVRAQGVGPRTRLLLNGAGGGGGTLAVQFGRALGAHVTAVDRASKLTAMTALGADRVIDFETKDAFAQGERYDLILDFYGTRRPRQIAPALAPGGRYLTVGGPMGPLLSVLAGGLWRRSGGRRYRVLAVKQTPERLRAAMEAFRELGLRPVVDRVYRLDDAPEAFRRLGAGASIGKVIVTP